MSATSFEFLASFEEWEAACLKNPRELDTLPAELAGPAQWTVGGTILNTLAPFTQGKAGITKQSLASLAKDGENQRGGKDAQDLIKGFPGLVRAMSFADTAAEPTPGALWREFSEPSPALLDVLPKGSILFRLRVQLTSPWYSRDDLPFYPMENSLRRNAVFDQPFLSAAGLKGLLHWAHHMVRQSTEEDEDSLFLFGSAVENAGTSVLSHGGLLYTYPVNWQGALGLEVINPQRPATGGGTNPIKYEVVQAGGRGTLFFLLANLPGVRRLKRAHIQALLRAVDFLVGEGSLSAKSTIGWGRGALLDANVAVGGIAQASGSSLAQQALDKAAEEAWRVLCDENGHLLPLNGHDDVFTNKRLKALLPHCSNKMLKDREGCYAQLVELHAARTGQANAREETATWLLGESGVQTCAELSDRLLQVLATKEGCA